MPWGGWLLFWGVFLGIWAGFEAGLPTWSWTPRPPDNVATLVPKPVRPIALPPTNPLPSSLPRVNRTAFLESRPTYDTLTAFPSAWMLHGPTATWFAMDRLAQRLNRANTTKLDVFHWGDSQIEGDRITGTVRASWQRTWGGRGPGWILPLSPSNSFALKAKRQGSIVRKLGYGNQRNTSHRFLPFLGFNEFGADATWKARGNPIGHQTNHGWTQTRLWCAGVGTWLGNTDSVTWVGRAERKDTMLRWQHPPLLDSDLVIQTRGGVIAGVELTTPEGVFLHNLPMRGGSGTLFDDIPDARWKRFLSQSNPGLIILQFGGNALATMTQTSQVKRYASAIGQNLDHLKALMPDVPVVFVGPSDMGLDPGEFPMLAATIEALKQATFAHGAMYWDLQAVMGGPGSMAQWVDQGLAARDGIHFSPKGATLIGQRLDMALRQAMRVSQPTEPFAP